MNLKKYLDKDMGTYEMYVDRAWYDRSPMNKQQSREILISHILVPFTQDSILIEKELVKRGCTPEYRLTIYYEEQR